MKKIICSILLLFNLFILSCGGGETNSNEDPTGNERGTPGTGTQETGTGQDAEDTMAGKDSLPVSPADSVQPHSH